MRASRGVRSGFRTACGAALALAVVSAPGAAPAVRAQSAGGDIMVAPLDPLDTAVIDGRAESIPAERVVLRALDKFTGEVRTLEAAVGSEIVFERLTIEVRACYVRSGARAPESSAFLRIVDAKTLANPETAADGPAFSGWMFASSPALSAMDHSRYDVWVLSCANS